MSRRDVARQGEPGDLSGFPTRRLTTRRGWSRCHRIVNGAWFFSSATRPGVGGRWDLPRPDGTCYVAADDMGAFMEAFGPEILDQGFVLSSEIAARAITRLKLPEPHVVADLSDDDVSTFGVTSELTGAVSYEMTQRWAATWHQVGCEGVVYGLRFRPNCEGLGLFGAAGPRDWPTDAAGRQPREVARRLKVRVVEPDDIGSLSDFQVVEP